MSKKRFYRRVDPHQVSEELLALARALREMGWDEIGGRLLRNEATGEVIGRTKWVPRAQWWAERPFWFNERQVAGVVHKLLRCERLTPMETRIVKHLLEVAGVEAPAPASQPEMGEGMSCVA